MKNFILTLSILTSPFLIAQENVVKTDYIKKSKKVTVTALENGEYVEKDVKIITLKETNVKFNPNQQYLLNQQLIKTPINVTKVIMIDEDKDNFYDRAVKVNYTLPAGNALVEDNNLNLSEISHNVDTDDSENKNYTGSGYFNDKGKFIAKYYDEFELNSESL